MTVQEIESVRQRYLAQLAKIKAYQGSQELLEDYGCRALDAMVGNLNELVQQAHTLGVDASEWESQEKP